MRGHVQRVNLNSPINSETLFLDVFLRVETGKMVPESWKLGANAPEPENRQSSSIFAYFGEYSYFSGP